MKATLFDGVKSFNLPLDINSDFGWDVYGQEVKDAELYSRVSIVFAAMNLNERALASLPFVIYDANGEEWDTSANYENKLGFLPQPGKLFGLWRKSLAFTNSAYALMDKRGRKTELRYIVPTTIQIDSDPALGVKGFWRQLQGMRTYYPVSSGQMVYAHRTDYDSELLPSKNTEFQALMAAAGILYWSDHYVGDFFKRGGIKPHMLMVKGAPSQDERARIESTWDKLMRGMRNYIGKVYNAETIDAKPLGAGVDDFKDNEFYKQALQNVATVTGIPMSLLLANSANLATARQEFKTWYDYSVAPWAAFIAEEINAHLLDRFDLHIEFLTEQTDPDQEEEFRRAGAFQIYANTLLQNGNPHALSIAAQIVGLDLPRDVELEDLDEKVEEPQPETSPQVPQTAAENDPADSEDMDTGQEDTAKAFVPNAAQIVELKTWLDIAERKHKKGEGAPVWENKTIPPQVYDAITLSLAKAQSVEDITSAFDLTRYTVTQTPVAEYKSSDIMALAEAINKLAERTPDASRNEPA